MSEEQIRKDFEEWMGYGGLSQRAIERNSKGDYILMQAASAWHVWKAAHTHYAKSAAPVVLPPHPDTARLQQAVWRLEDILKNDDPQAWKEASKFLELLKKEQREEAKPAAPVVPPEPFGYFKPFVDGWMDCVETDEGARPLYEAPQPQVVPGFNHVAAKKLKELQARGYTVAGYSIEKTSESGAVERGFITSGGFVGWWQGQHTNQQPQADARDAESWVSESIAKPIESDGEVFVRFSDGTFGTGWAAYWHGASNDFAQWCHPDPDEDRTVTHWMKPPTIDAAIAAAKENK